MKRDKENAGRMSVHTPGESVLCRVRRFCVTVMILVAIALVLGVFVARTAGCRTLVEDRLARLTGADVTVGSSRIGWPYTLVLENVKLAARGGEGAAAARALRIALAGGLRWRVRLDGAELVLQGDADGRWSPACFARLGPVPERGVAEVARATAGLRRRFELDCRDCGIRWVGPDGRVRGVADKVSLRLSPVRVPGCRLAYYRLSVDRLAVGTERSEFVEREWLASDSRPYLELYADSGTPVEAGGFWSAGGETRYEQRAEDTRKAARRRRDSGPVGVDAPAR
jgi:hypothetical protein